MGFRVSGLIVTVGWFSDFDCGSQGLDLLLSLGWLSAVRPGVAGLRMLLVGWFAGMTVLGMLAVSCLRRLAGLVGLLRVFSFGGGVVFVSCDLFRWCLVWMIWWV